MMRKKKTIAAVLLVLTLSIGLRVLWVEYYFEISRSLHAVKSSSKLARWWRCYGVRQPMLADSKSPWSFDFTYDGNGESKRELHVDSEGVASILVAGQGDVKSGQRSHKLSSWQTAELAHLIDDTGLLCQSTQVRRNIVMDIGRFTAIVHSDRMPPHTLTIDECRYIPDSAALAEILDLLGRTNSLLAEPTEWGPAGTITLEEHCGPTEPN